MNIRITIITIVQIINNLETHIIKIVTTKKIIILITII